MNNTLLLLLLSLSLLSACGSSDKEQKAPATSNEKATLNTSIDVAQKKSNPDDDVSGTTLHKENCMKCHDDASYQKTNSKMKDYAGLHKMVGMCNTQVGADLFPEELQKLTNYLNDSFYKFSKP